MKNKNTGYKLTQNQKSDLQFLSEWIDLKTDKSDETATMIIEKITEMLKEKKNYPKTPKKTPIFFKTKTKK